MTRIKVLFLYPNHKGNYMLPPAIGILSACLKKAGHEVDLFDTTQYASFELAYRPSVDVDKSKADRLMAKPFEETEQLKEINTDIYEDWEKYMQSLTYNFEQELSPHVDDFEKVFNI